MTTPVPSSSRWHIEATARHLASLVPNEFLAHHEPEQIQLVQPPSPEDLDTTGFLVASKDYAAHVQGLIAVGTPILICPVGGLPQGTIPTPSLTLRTCAAKVLAHSWHGWLQDMIARFEKGAPCKLEDGSDLVDGSLQLPYGELWWDGPAPYTGAVSTQAGEFVFLDGRVISAPPKLAHLLPPTVHHDAPLQLDQEFFPC